MTVREAIDKADLLYPNVFSFSEKAEWLRELDMKLSAELFSRYPDHKDSEKETSGQYTPDTRLLIEGPYENLYILFIVMKTDIVNSDTVRYQNSSALFNNEYLAFSNHYNRTHMIKSAGITLQ